MPLVLTLGLAACDPSDAIDVDINPSQAVEDAVDGLQQGVDGFNDAVQNFGDEGRTDKTKVTARTKNRVNEQEARRKAGYFTGT